MRSHPSRIAGGDCRVALRAPNKNSAGASEALGHVSRMLCSASAASGALLIRDPPACAGLSITAQDFLATPPESVGPGSAVHHCAAPRPGHAPGYGRIHPARVGQGRCRTRNDRLDAGAGCARSRLTVAEAPVINSPLALSTTSSMRVVPDATAMERADASTVAE